MKRTTHAISSFLSGNNAVGAALVAHIASNEMRKRENETQAQMRYEAGLYPAKTLDFTVDNDVLTVSYLPKRSRRRTPFEEEHPLAQNRSEVIQAIGQWLDAAPQTDAVRLAEIAVLFWNVVYLFRHQERRLDSVQTFIEACRSIPVDDEPPLRASAELRPAPTSSKPQQSSDDADDEESSESSEEQTGNTELVTLNLDADGNLSDVDDDPVSPKDYLF